jgi:maleylpyruvate isomerase
VGKNGFDLTAALDDVEKATEHLIDTAEGLSDADVAAPSLLPNWTRGHVLTHVARSGDALGNLLTWARTGVETPMYASAEARAEAIEAGAARPATEQAADLRSSAARFAGACRSLPPEAWEAEVRHRTGKVFPARLVPWMRLREVLIHHADLDAGYTPAHWPAGFVSGCLQDAATDLAQRPDAPAAELHAEDTGDRYRLYPGDAAGTGVTVVSGPAPALLAWLIGRSAGDGLDVEPAGSLPALPAWL